MQHIVGFNLFTVQVALVIRSFLCEFNYLRLLGNNGMQVLTRLGELFEILNLPLPLN